MKKKGDKIFKIDKNNIIQLIEPMGSCVASDKITIEGLQVGYMYREKPIFNTDSGWRIFSGTESQEFVDNPDNLNIYDLNTIANYDPSIVPFLRLSIGTEIERTSDGSFSLVDP